MATTNTNHVTKAEMEKYLSKILEIRLRQAIEEYVETNEIRLKELSVLERIVRVEEELKSLREISEVKFEALQREMKAGFDAMEKRFEASEKRFESLQREMNTRFEAVDKRFESLQGEMNARFEAADSRFESLQREMNARFEAADKRFSDVQWMIGILVGIPAIAITIIQVIGALK